MSNELRLIWINISKSILIKHLCHEIITDDIEFMVHVCLADPITSTDETCSCDRSWATVRQGMGED